jgi:hypothetical protein
MLTGKRKGQEIVEVNHHNVEEDVFLDTSADMDEEEQQQLVITNGQPGASDHTNSSQVNGKDNLRLK